MRVTVVDFGAEAKHRPVQADRPNPEISGPREDKAI
jgi:hypothetical protein